MKRAMINFGFALAGALTTATFVIWFSFVQNNIEGFTVFIHKTEASCFTPQ